MEGEERESKGKREGGRDREERKEGGRREGGKWKEEGCIEEEEEEAQWKGEQVWRNRDASQVAGVSTLQGEAPMRGRGGLTYAVYVRDAGLLVRAQNL